MCMYIWPDQIFEAFMGIAYDLTMNDDEFLQLVECSKVYTYNCCMIILVPCHLS